jgi:hypothetical protein
MRSVVEMVWYQRILCPKPNQFSSKFFPHKRRNFDLLFLLHFVKFNPVQPSAAASNEKLDFCSVKSFYIFPRCFSRRGMCWRGTPFFLSSLSAPIPLPPLTQRKWLPIPSLFIVFLLCVPDTVCI